jgi:hypothetical protein
LAKKTLISQSISLVSAAFSNLHGKGSPQLQTTFSTIHATTTNSGPGFVLQTRPLSSEGIITLFKSDPQKKLNKEQDAKVGSFPGLVVLFC